MFFFLHLSSTELASTYVVRIRIAIANKMYLNLMEFNDLHVRSTAIMWRGHVNCLSVLAFIRCRSDHEDSIVQLEDRYRS